MKRLLVFCLAILFLPGAAFAALDMTAKYDCMMKTSDNPDFPVGLKTREPIQLGAIVSVGFEGSRSIDFCTHLKPARLGDGSLILATQVWERREIYGTIFVKEQSASELLLDIVKINTGSAFDPEMQTPQGSVVSSAEKYRLSCRIGPAV